MDKSIKKNLYLIGPMGAGKSTVGKQLAKTLHKNFLDTDLVIEDRTGVDVAWIFSVEGEDGFRKREKDIVAELTQQNDLVLSTGGGTVVELSNRQALSNTGIVIYLQTSRGEQLERTSRNRGNRPLLQVDNIEERIDSLMQERQRHYEEIADYSVCTDNKSVRQVVTEILNQMDIDT
jgi:shikimate kinase